MDLAIRPRAGKLSAYLMRVPALLLLALALSGCGYHTASSGHSRLPQSIKTIAVPAFINQTQTYRIEQTMTAAVIRELTSRTNYRVVDEVGDSTDATLRGTIVSTSLAPLTYDSQTGRASSALVTVNMKVSLIDKSGKVLFDQENYTFREEYQVTREISSFFEEDSAALDRLSRDFSRQLVADMLENY
jgi:outer membrane lipopolysaccharide assembly protein LptE/RlpB